MVCRKLLGMCVNKIDWLINFTALINSAVECYYQSKLVNVRVNSTDVVCYHLTGQDNAIFHTPIVLQFVSK